MTTRIHAQPQTSGKITSKSFFTAKYLAAGLAVSASMMAASQSQAQTSLAVDSSKPWIGFVNVFTLPANGDVYQFGQAVATNDVRGFFTGTNTLTLQPNTLFFNPTDTNYVNADGSGNRYIDASFYVQDDTLAGQALTFNGTCLTNTLIAPYICTAFIKDFAPDYSFNTPTTATLTPGQSFSITLGTTPGHHIQYGFELIGPDANPATLANLGQVVMAVNNADPTIGSLAAQSLVEGQTAHFSVTAQGTAPFTYEWFYGPANNAVLLSDTDRISGTSTNTLVISNVVVADAGQYSAFVMNAVGNTAVASANLSVVPLAQAKTNLLIDPSFESGMFATTSDAGWVNFNGAAEVNTNGFYFNTSTPINVLDGADAVQTYSTGTGTYNGIYQDRPAVPGQVYTASGWLYTPSADKIGGAGLCWLEIQFQDANGGIVGFYKSGSISSSSPADVWIQVQPTNHYEADETTLIDTPKFMVAPPGTVKVRFQITHHADTGGSVYLDLMDLKLRAPVPVVATTNATLDVTFPTLFGPIYQVLYKNNLTDSSWLTLTNVTGDGTTKTVKDPIGTGKRFYTVNTQ
jgi:hypothetical protein